LVGQDGLGYPSYPAGHYGDAIGVEILWSFLLATVVLNVATVVEGLQPISGTFRVGLQDAATQRVDRTPPLPHDVSGVELKGVGRK
jgi:hypothetical protein